MSLPPLPINLAKAFPFLDRMSMHDVGFGVTLLRLLWEAPENALHMPIAEIERIYFDGKPYAPADAWKAQAALLNSFWWHRRDEMLYSPYVLELVARPTPRTPVPVWMKREALEMARRADPDGGEFHACHYCDGPVGSEYHIDHALPLLRGGLNHPMNLHVSCPSCNFAKGYKTEAEFREGRPS